MEKRLTDRRRARLGRAGRLGRQPAVGLAGMVSTPHPFASETGVAVLRSGGNAVDAALAISAALMVAVPHQCSLGGDAFWLIRPPSGPTVAYNGSGRAPAAADADRLRATGHTRMPERGAVAISVPGLVESWAQVHGRYATRGLDELVEPAAAQATIGLAVSPYMTRQLAAADPLLRSRDEASRLFRPGGRPLRVGDRLALPDLAQSLRGVANDPRSLYHGALAQRIADAVKRAGGWLRAQDLADHRGAWETPLGLEIGGRRIEELGPNSQGWLALLTLALVDRRAGGSAGAGSIHVGVEAAKIAWTVRDLWLADPASMPVEPGALLSDDWIDRAAGWIIDRPRSPVELRDLIGGTSGATPGRGDTAHFAVVDRDGMAVSCIQSVYFDFGTGIVPDGTGFTLQNRGAGFSLVEGHPNELRPGCRPMHTLAPAMETRGGRISTIFGCMGGDAQTQIHVQVLTALAASPDPAAATAAPRWFVRPAGDAFELLVESRLRDATRLAALGHRITRVEPYDEVMGHAQVLTIHPEGFVLGAADPRSDGVAIAQ